MGCACCKRGTKIPRSSICDLSENWELKMLDINDWDNLFSKEEIEMLADKWRYSMDYNKSKEFGSKFYAKFFQQAPAAQKLFFQVSNNEYLHRYEWQRQPLFISHVCRFLNGIDFAICLLNEPVDLVNHLNRIREIHRLHPDIIDSHAEIFVRTFERCAATALGTSYTNEFKIVFRKFLTLLYSVIFQDWELMSEHCSFSEVYQLEDGGMFCGCTKMSK